MGSVGVALRPRRSRHGWLLINNDNIMVMGISIIIDYLVSGVN